MSFMSMKELRSFCRVLDGTSLEFWDESTRSIIGQANNAVYFTQEQFAAKICFFVLLLVKQFLHVTRASPRACSFECFFDFSGL